MVLLLILPYSFRLCAHNNEGNSPFTKTVTFSTILGVSVPPILLADQCKPASDSLWVRWISDDTIQICIDKLLGFNTVMNHMYEKSLHMKLAIGLRICYLVRVISENSGSY